MSKVVSFDYVVNRKCKLVIDCTYMHGKPWTLSVDALSNLMNVKNVGGFRTKGNSSPSFDVKYVILYSTNEDVYWRDQLDTSMGSYIYYGDNKKAGVDLHGPFGNKILKKVYDFAESDDVNTRKKIPPFFLFESDKENGGVKFRGLLVPGYRGVNHFDWLTAVWAQLHEGGRFQNYKALFTVLDTSKGSDFEKDDASINLNWLSDLANGNGFESKYAPIAWKEWISKGKYTPLTISVESSIRCKDDQLPKGRTPKAMLKTIYDYFKEKPTDFESFAISIVTLADNNILNCENTRPTRDGGRDGIGEYIIMKNISNNLKTTFAVEAKCYDPDNSVGVKETSRLISRIRHRQFGVFVTTSYIAPQAYEEIIEDEQPISIISGKDIIDILYQNQINDVDSLNKFLTLNFSKNINH